MSNEHGYPEWVNEQNPASELEAEAMLHGWQAETSDEDYAHDAEADYENAD